MNSSDRETITAALHLLREYVDRQDPDFAIEINGDGVDIISGDGVYLCRGVSPETAIQTLIANRV